MEQIENWLVRLTDGDEIAMLGLHILLIVLAIVIFNFVMRRVLAHFSRTAQSENTLIELSVVAAARQPLFALAWVVGITFAGKLVQAQTDIAVLAIAHPAHTIGVIACLGWFLVRFITNAKETLIRRWAERGENVDRTTVEAISQLLRIAVLIATVLVALQSLGFSIEGVLAFGGIGGIAIGFAAKDLLANFFGSLIIYFDRPFAVGDWIRSPDKQIEGTVEGIGWRLTCIRTFDKRPLYVPNSVFTSIAVENPSRMTHRRINEIIGVRYDDIAKVADIAKDIRAMLHVHPGIDQNQSIIVNFTQFNESSLDFMVQSFTRTTVSIEFNEVKQDVLLKIAEIIDRHGAQIAFPTRVNYVTPLPPDTPPNT
ncbi:MAG: mechanosensitive ion channel family protein [Candidatus Accumulibacter sp.]|jgi:MscS family membrane protein|nr:mechanosensitive ion channel family protein [Accumulibacter sp.]